MGNFWFEERGAEDYFSYGRKTITKGRGKTRRSWTETDWDKKIAHTREEYETYVALRDSGHGAEDSIYRQGPTTPLSRVDEIICEFMKDPRPDLSRDSRWFYICHEWGYLSLFKLGGSYVEERHVDWMHEKISAAWRESDKSEDCKMEIERLWALLHWVFLRKWRFHATG